MKTVPEIINPIIDRMYFRMLIHKTICNAPYNPTERINGVAIETLQAERKRVYQIRMSMDAIAVDMIARGEY